MAAQETPRLTPAQLRALRSLVGAEAAEVARIRRAIANGATCPDPGDEPGIALACDERSRGALIEADLIGWARGFDDLIILLPAGRALAARA